MFDLKQLESQPIPFLILKIKAQTATWNQRAEVKPQNLIAAKGKLAKYSMT